MFKLAENLVITEAREKDKDKFGILRILGKVSCYVLLNLEAIRLYLIKLATVTTKPFPG
jgi:hypothetical protein